MGFLMIAELPSLHGGDEAGAGEYASFRRWTSTSAHPSIASDIRFSMGRYDMSRLRNIRGN